MRSNVRCVVVPGLGVIIPLFAALQTLFLSVSARSISVIRSFLWCIADFDKPAL